MASLTVLSEQAASTSSALVRCAGCTKCCESGGPVYVQDGEVEHLLDLGVPLVQLDGVHFIKRLPDGACPMLDRRSKKCVIYATRPLCCRLFPFDIFSVASELRWAFYLDCPDDRKSFSESQGLGSPLGLGTIGRLASILESAVSDDTFEFFRRKERAAKNSGILEEDQKGVWKVISGKIVTPSEPSNA
jgi:Fe-S-cluster containining protein